MPTPGQWSCPNCRGLLAGPGSRSNLLALAGLGMILIGIGFKLALVPFHFWAADVYEGAPAPVTALIATASKGAVFALLFRYFGAMSVQMREPVLRHFHGASRSPRCSWATTWPCSRATSSVCSPIPRLPTWAICWWPSWRAVALAVTAVTFYLLAYFITTLGAFGVITALSNKETDFSRLAGYRGLVASPSVARRRSWP